MKPSFDTDMQGDVLAVHRGDSNRDEILRYPNKTDVEGFRDGDDDGWRTLGRDEQNTLDMVQDDRLLKEEEVNTSCEERVSISRDEVRGMVKRDGENPGGNDERKLQERHGREDERDMLSKCEKGDEHITSMEDKRDSLKASSENEVVWCSSESAEKEDGRDSLKQYEPLQRVNRDDEQAVLERDEKVLGFVSRDNEESGSGSPERNDNDLSTEITKLDTEVPNGQTKADELKVGGSEEDTGTLNRYENRDENRVLEKDGEDNSSLMLREKDDEPQSLRCETQVNDTSVRKMEMREVTGEQDSSPCTADAVKVAGETFQNVYFNGPVLPQSPTQGHRRTQSEIGTPGHRRTNSFQRLKTQMQKAWRGVSNLREDNRPTFNPEVLANQKRQWYQLHSSKTLVFNLSMGVLSNL